MSLFSIFTAGLACVSFASAYTQPKGDSPSGNPISQPGLNSIVPTGESFSVTWQPTTKGTVTLVLLKGPSENAVPQYAIAEKIPNNGLFAWTPSNDLAPTSDATGYGIQLIDDSTGAYQYTTQFGISNDDYSASSATSSSAWAVETTSSASWSGAAHGPGPQRGPQTGSWSDSWSSDSWTTSVSSYSKVALNSTAPYATAPIVTAPAVTGTAPSGRSNVTMVAPTGAVTSSAVLSSSASATSGSATRASNSPAAPTASNAAASVATSFAGLVIAGAVAVFAL